MAQIKIIQRKELWELIGYESRNKYEIRDSNNQVIAFAAEQGSNILGILFRQLLGHWRPFDILVYNNDRTPIIRARHPFRIFFQKIEIVDLVSGKMLAILQQRFAIFSKRFDVIDPTGNTVFKMRSPFWRIWTFPIFQKGKEVARIHKKWRGILSEAFTDTDNFTIDIPNDTLSNGDKMILTVSAIFIDLLYFERKAGK